MIDAGALDLHQDLVLCDRRPRYIVEHQIPTVLKQSHSLHHALREFLASWLPMCPAPISPIVFTSIATSTLIIHGCQSSCLDLMRLDDAASAVSLQIRISLR